MKKEISKLIKGLEALKVSYRLQGRVLDIDLGMGAYSSINVDTLKVIECVDVQEWAETFDGIMQQLEKKLN